MLKWGTFSSCHPRGYISMHTCVYLYTEHTQTHTHAHVCHAKGRNDELITSRPSASNMGPTAVWAQEKNIC